MAKVAAALEVQLSIPWQPIENMPEEYKDGRRLLLWWPSYSYDGHDEYPLADVGWWTQNSRFATRNSNVFARSSTFGENM